MGNPITWQNVTQGDASTAWRAMESAQKSINGAFDGLGGVIKEREAIDAGNVVVQGKNNTNSYLNQVAELGKTPEALQARIADGSLDRLRASFGPNIDQAATRGAADALLSTRYAQVEAATKHGHAMADERSHPFMQAYKVASLQGDKPGMAKADAAYTAAGGRDLPGLVGFADAREQEMTLRGRGTDEHGWKGEDHVSKLKDRLVSQEIARGQLGVSQRNADTNAAGVSIQRENMQLTKQGFLDTREANALATYGKTQSNTAGSKEGSAELFADITTTFKGDDSGAANARRALGEIIDKYPGISTGAARMAVLSQDASSYVKNNAWVRSNTVDRAGVFQGTPEEILRQQSSQTQREAALDLYSRARDAARNGPMGAGKSSSKAEARLVDAAAKAKKEQTPTTPAVRETSNTMALKVLDPAIKQTVQAIRAADASGNTKEVQRLTAIMIEQTQARSRVVGLD